MDAAFLLTVGSFLLTVELFYLQLTILAFLLTIGASSRTISVILLTVGAFLLILFNLQLEHFLLTLGKCVQRDCKRRSLTVSEAAKGGLYKCGF